MSVFLFYGQNPEYSLEPLENSLVKAGHEVMVAMDWSEADFKERLDSQIQPDKTILLSSAHPGINQLTGRNNIPVATLRKMGPWKKIGFFPHDLSEPFRWEERQYLNDYDFFLYEFPIPEWIRSYLRTIKISGIQREKVFLPLESDYLFLPDDFWSFGLGTAGEFLSRFPFAQDPRVVTKFHNIPAAYILTESLRNKFAINILDPSIPGFELITPQNGILLTQGLSSVVSEARISKMSCTFILENELSSWEREKLKFNHPAISDFHNARIPLPPRRAKKDRERVESKTEFNMTEFLSFCE